MNNVMSDVFSQVAKSPWRGIITEIGFGMILSHNYILDSEDTQTIISTCSPLNSEFANPENRLEEDNMKSLLNYTAELDQTEGRNTAPRFYLALSGIHKSAKESGENQGWLGLRTSIPRESGLEISDTLIHFKISKIYQNMEIPTEEIFSLVTILSSWALKTLLLGSYSSWSDAIDKLPYYKFVHLDIISDSRISIKEHLSLVSLNNPLVYKSGRFVKAVEAIRSYSNFVTGNVTHSIDNALSIFNLGKNDSAIPEADSIILRECSYVPFQVSLLKKVLKDQPFTITLDCPTFNNIFDPYSIPGNNNELFSGMSPEQEKASRESILLDFLKPLFKTSGVSFQVICNESDIVIENDLLENINFKIENF